MSTDEQKREESGVALKRQIAQLKRELAATELARDEARSLLAEGWVIHDCAEDYGSTHINPRYREWLKATVGVLGIDLEDSGEWRELEEEAQECLSEWSAHNLISKLVMSEALPPDKEGGR